MDGWQRQLLTASGYLDLGMLDDAATELEQIDPGDQLRPEVLDFRVALYARAEKWTAMEVAARKMVALRPEIPGTWANWAFATRRATSLDAAKEILLRAERKHPADALIQFNLGCYACQLGDLAEAKSRVQRAIQIDRSFQRLAADDPDLEPLRKRGAGTGG